MAHETGVAAGRGCGSSHAATTPLEELELELDDELDEELDDELEEELDDELEEELDDELVLEDDVEELDGEEVF